MEEKQKVVEALSGVLDTSFTVMSLVTEKGYDEDAACANTGRI